MTTTGCSTCFAGAYYNLLIVHDATKRKNGPNGHPSLIAEFVLYKYNEPVTSGFRERINICQQIKRSTELNHHLVQRYLRNIHRKELHSVPETLPRARDFCALEALVGAR